MTSQTRSFVQAFLPARAKGALRLEEIAETENAVVLTVSAIRRSAQCPVCQRTTTRIHSRYQRRVRDLPWGHRCVSVVLQVRRFRCSLRRCPRQIFTERLPFLVTPHARSTTRSHSALRHIGLALGGQAGARLTTHLRLPTSATSLLRAVRGSPEKTTVSPRVIGIDDFARRKGHTYGTIIVDLERRQPIALLPDRSAATVAQWLKRQTAIEIVCTDRSPDYARAIAEAAPHVLAVADRWHLLKNLREAIERLLDRHQRDFHGIILPTMATANPSLAVQPRLLSPGEHAARDGRRTRKAARFAQARELHELGMSAREISQRLGISRTTVGRYLHADHVPEQAHHGQKPSLLDPFAEDLQRRWEAGCHNAQQLHRELQAQGYRGTRKLVARWAQARREIPAPSTPKRYLGSQPAMRGDTERTATSPRGGHRQYRPSSRRLSWLLIRAPETLSAAERRVLRSMQEASAAVRTAYPLAQEFGALVRQRVVADTFSGWLDRVLTSEIPALVAFGTGLRRDEAAVRASLTSRWSNGQTEGQVTKLKQLKRQMYGRANLDLLWRRLVESG